MKRTRAPRRIQRGNRLLQERVHDPYRAGEKLSERTVCPQCGVIYRNGRWRWPRTESAALKRQLCPACRRINDDYPAGELLLAGSFLSAHRGEILASLRHIADAERQEHPLNRVISIDEQDGETVIRTTDVHLPHRMAHALRNAWGGSMSTHYDIGGYFTRVLWERDA